MSAFCTMRRLCLSSILVAVYPAVSVGTMNPLTWVLGALRPDDRDVAEGRVADPPLRAVEHPVVAVTRRDRAEALGRVRTRERLGQAERPDEVSARHAGQPLGALLGRPPDADRPHRQAVLHADEGRDGRVDPGELEGDPAAEDRGVLERARLFPRHAEEPEPGEALDDLVREGRVRPVPVHTRLDLGLEIPTEVGQHALLTVGEQVFVTVEVADERGERGEGR